MAEEQKKFEEMSYNEREKLRDSLVKQVEIELLETKLALLRQIKVGVATSNNHGGVNFAQAYAMINGTYTGGSSNGK